MHCLGNVLDPPAHPVFRINETNITGSVKMIEGGTMTVLCLSDGKPDPDSYIWVFPGGTYSGPAITISAVHRDRTGTYSCSVQNTMSPTIGHIVRGNNQNSFSLDVLCKYKTSKMSFS